MTLFISTGTVTNRSKFHVCTFSSFGGLKTHTQRKNCASYHRLHITDLKNFDCTQSNKISVKRYSSYFTKKQKSADDIYRIFYIKSQDFGSSMWPLPEYQNNMLNKTSDKTLEALKQENMKQQYCR